MKRGWSAGPARYGVGVAESVGAGQVADERRQDLGGRKAAAMSRVTVGALGRSGPRGEVRKAVTRWEEVQRKDGDSMCRCICDTSLRFSDGSALGSNAR